MAIAKCVLLYESHHRVNVFRSSIIESTVGRVRAVYLG